MSKKAPFLRFVLLSLAVLFSLPALGTETLFETRFEGTDGSLPEGWTALTRDPVIEIRRNALVLRRDGRPGTGAARTLMLDTDESRGWTNVVVEATFRESNPGIAAQRNGVLARWDGGRSFPLKAYNAYVSADSLVIAFGVSRGNEAAEVLASSTISTPLRPNQPYTIRFTLSGSRLVAELFDGAGNGMAKVETEHDLLTAGGIGIQSYFSFGERQVSYEHLAVSPAE